MKRIFLLAGIGAAAGFVAALVATQYIPDLSLGVTIDSLGKADYDTFVFYDKPYGLVGNTLLGLLVAGVVAAVAVWHRPPAVRLRSGLIAGVAGALLCNAAAAASDLTFIGMARGLSSDGKLTLTQLDAISTVPSLMWYLLAAFGLSLAIFLGIGPSRALFGRVWIGTGLGAVVAIVIANILLVLILPVLLFEVVSNPRIESINVTTFVKPIIWGELFGMGAGAAAAFALAEMFWKPAWLKAFRGTGEGRSWTLTGQISRVGYEEGIEVRLPPDGTVAPVHAQIQAKDDAHYIVAVGGETQVNGQPVQTAWLKDGDNIGVGSALILFRTRLKGKSKGQELPSAVAHAPDPLQMPTLTDSMGNEHKLHNGVNVVGRELGCDVALTWEQSVSRRHAEVVVDHTTVTVRDLGSTNGTFVGGQRITAETPVASGTEITFGRTVVRLG